ncbi:uncharacterized protein LOC114749777 [Neltuma alba]|uniref:uncharacterized protein LOC114749777 n=1 Tax=Neltuma alba TaxID=207710 RepID=UPI0010A2E4EC|nr:uncharacterized protein LOC114749777 [Prosopis alba]
MTENPKHTLETGLESADRPSKIAKTEDFSDEEEEQKPAIHDPSMSQNPRIQRYLVAVEYIGTRFFGSQKQPNCRTVVGALEIVRAELHKKIEVGLFSCDMVVMLRNEKEIANNFI